MPIINIQVRRKKAGNTVARIVCGNSDYKIAFNFDEEWNAQPTKTARFVWNGQFQDVVFTGNMCDVPVLNNTTLVAVGVYAGDLSTTTPALITCDKSILCEGGLPADPAPDVYAQILDLLNQVAAAPTVKYVEQELSEEEQAQARKNIGVMPLMSITPEMYGAVGDGVTDDSVALQNAIDYCVTNDVPLVASGKYLFSQGLVIDNNGMAKTPKINFAGDLIYTGDNFAFLLSGWYISLTLNGHLNCTAGGGIKIWDKDGTRWTAFNKVSFFTITTQGNGIEIYAAKNGVYNNEVNGTNMGRFSKGVAEIIKDGSCGVKLYAPDNPSGGPFVSENTLSIRWIHNYHYGVYNGYGENGATKDFGLAKILFTSFESNGVGIALINARAVVHNPRMDELRGEHCAYYLDGHWALSGDNQFNLGLARFGEHRPASPNGFSITNGYGAFEVIAGGNTLWTKSGIYIPAGCRQAWAFNLDDNSIKDTLWVNDGYVLAPVISVDDYEGLSNIFSGRLTALYKKFIFGSGKTGGLVLGKMFYNHYNVNSIEIVVSGQPSVDRYIYHGDGTLLLTIPTTAKSGDTATIKWEQGGSDEAAFTPTVEASWLTE